MNNNMNVIFDAKSIIEGFARMAVASFMAQLNPTIEQLDDVKTAVSEAVTNSIVHAYSDNDKQVELDCKYDGNMLTIKIIDNGIGIEDVEKAMQPFFTTKEEFERTGMGFTFMQTFMDEVEVTSKINHGTCVIMKKYIESSEV